MNPERAFALALFVLGGIYFAQTQPAALASVSDKLAFLRAFGPVVLAEVKKRNWPIITAPLLIAWAAMESAWGKSKLAVEDFNVFGVKAGPTWIKQGSPYVAFASKEHQGTPQETTEISNFRRYPSWAAALVDLLHMLSITDIFKGAYAKLSEGDYQGFFQAIDASGYSTAARYSDRIKNFLNDIAGVA